MYAQVVPAKRGLVSLPFFDYAIPPELDGKLLIGQLVYVPFRNREELGVVRGLSENPAAPIKKIKPIKSIFFDKPIFTEKELGFLEEISALYRTSLGLLVKTALPPLQKRKLSKIEPNPYTIMESGRQFSKPKLFVYSSHSEKIDYFKNNFSKDGQTLIVVPELTDIDETLNSLSPEDRKNTAVLTSYLSEKEYFSAWMEVWKGEKTLIIGTRQALFLSFHDLRTIFVDNEAHTSHKSWDMAPRVNARDAALIAAKFHKASLHITCHQPSIETYYFAKEGIYEAADNKLFSRVRQHPSVINMQHESKGGNFGPLADDLKDAIMSSTGSVFLFCHRKGTASYVMCRDCGLVMKCPNCNRPLTYHESRGEMVCHLCKYQEFMSSNCKACGGINLARFGVGAEAVAKEVKKILGHDKREIIVIEETKEMLKKLDPGSDQIIIGTQLAWNHINWESISVMANIDADTPLFIPEYKTIENVWQTIFDAAYKLPENTPYFIQTTHPEHIVFASIQSPDNFYETELKERKLFNYPPYRFVLKLFYGATGKDHGDKEVMKMYYALQHLTKSIPDIKITPPIEMFPPFKRGKYWQAIILKLPFKNYKQLTRSILRIVPDTWKVDPNPNTLLSL